MFSQYGEDEWIAQHVPMPAAGVFVEVGASNGILNSNTLAYELHGWTGLCVEPDPREHQRLSNARRCKLAFCLVGTEAADNVPLHLHPTIGWTGTTRTEGDVVQVPRLRLDTLLRIHGIRDVNLMSIDTEGTELDVWDSLGSYCRPQILIVEHETGGLPDISQQIHTRFISEGYTLLHKTQGNFIFTRTR